jgi:hypothetical protein
VPFYVLQDLELPHLPDLMHIKKNVIVSLIWTMSNTMAAKLDSLAMKQELEAHNMMPMLHSKKINQLNN